MKSYRFYIFIGVILLLCFSLPISFTSKLKIGMSSLLASSSKKFPNEAYQNKIENFALKNQIEYLENLLLSDQTLKKQIKELGETNYSKRLQVEKLQNIKKQYQALHGQVILRQPVSWSSSFWINLGDYDNEKLGETIIAENSPVLHQDIVIGVIEKVEKRKSLVRLITDPGLAISVRVQRDNQSDDLLREKVTELIELFYLKGKHQEAEQLQTFLTTLKTSSEVRRLAKGELIGMEGIYKRGCLKLLKGVGFNYDFDDEEGSSLDLRRGIPFGKKAPSSHLLQVGDLLVTTGMDGVYPPGLKVAVITQVFPLHEGSVSYDIEAKTLAGNLEEVSFVSVLPPVTSSF